MIPKSGGYFNIIGIIRSLTKPLYPNFDFFRNLDTLFNDVVYSNVFKTFSFTLVPFWVQVPFFICTPIKMEMSKDISIPMVRDEGDRKSVV